MARPREFSADEALERAMQVFWSKGYEATSLQDLIAAMGLSKSSFYDTFGSKHELFLAALERYIETVPAQSSAAIIEGADGVKAGIAALFAHYLDDLTGASERRGCFVNNSAVEMAPHDAAAAARVSAGLAHLEQAFYRALRRGQESGEISAAHDARALARYLTASLNGMLVIAKAKPEPETLEEVVGIVLSALE